MEMLWKISGIAILTIPQIILIGLIGYAGYKIGKFMEEWKEIKAKND